MNHTVILNCRKHKYVVCNREQVPNTHQPMRYFETAQQAGDFAEALNRQEVSLLASFCNWHANCPGVTR